MKIKLIGLLGLALSLCACATSPDKIAPSYVSELSFKDLDCDQIAQETLRMEQALVTASAAQKKARSNDTVGVIFIGLPVSSLSGSNQASHIAHLKGSLEAMAKTSTKKNCFKIEPES